MRNILLFFALLPLSIFAQTTLTFEQPFGTSDWVENGINWHFAEGWGDIRTYTPFNSNGHAMTTSVSPNKLIASQPIDIKGLYIYINCCPDYSNGIPHIYGYDANGVVLYDSLLSSLSDLSYQYIELNWDNVSQIRITSPHGICHEYVDPIDPDMSFTWCDEVYIFYDDIIYNPAPFTCSPPLNLYISNTSFQSTDLNWEAVNGRKYLVRSKLETESAWVVSDTLSAAQNNTYSYTLQGLNDATIYEWQVMAVCNDTLVSGYSSSLTFSTQCNPPVWESITASNITSKLAAVAWQGLGVPLDYNLRIRSMANMVWDTVAILQDTSVILDNLLPSSEYEIQIQTVCSGVNSSAYSDHLLFSTPCQNTASSIDTTVFSYFSIPGSGVFYQSGTHTATIQNSSGCDSTITINLTVNKLEQANILDFEESQGTTSWTEDGLNWYWQDGSDQIRNNHSNASSGMGYGESVSGSNSKLIFQQPLDLHSINLKYLGGAMTMGASIYGYDSLNNIVENRYFDMREENPIDLNWENVFAISFDVPYDQMWMSDPEDPNNWWYEPYPTYLYFDELVYSIAGTLYCAIPTSASVSLVTTSTAHLQWQGQDNKKYVVRYKAVDESVWAYSDTLISTGNQINNYTLNNLTNTTAYHWQVQAICGESVESLFSSSHTFTTHCPAPVINSPAYSGTSATLNWTDHEGSQDYTFRYRVYGEENWTTQTIIESTEYQMTGLTIGKGYETQVQSHCSVTESSSFSSSRYFWVPCEYTYVTIDTSIFNTETYIDPNGGQRTESGTFDVWVYESVTGCYTIYTINLQVIDAHTLVLQVPKTTLCQNEEVSLTATGCSTGTIAWSNNATGASQVFSGNTSFSVEAYCIIDGDTTQTSGQDFAVFAQPYIVASSTHLCSDSTLTLTARGITETTLLQWYKDGIKIEGATDSVLNVTESGNYTVGVMFEGDEVEWVIQHPANSVANQHITGIDFVNDNKGWMIVGNEVLHTADGGETWTVQLATNPLYNWNQIQMINESVGYVSTWNNIYKTTDGGVTWTDSSPSSRINKSHFININIGWAIINDTLLVKTINGGDTWVTVNNLATISELTNSSVKTLYFKDTNSGFLSLMNWDTYTNSLLKTEDGGENWSMVYGGGYSDIDNIQFTSPLIGYQSYWMLKTIDGGNTWNPISNFGNTFHFVNDNVGYKYYYGTVEKTMDGGSTWVNTEIPTSLYISSLFFTSESNGWAVGENGIICKLKPKRFLGCESDNYDIIINKVLSPRLFASSNSVCKNEDVLITASGCDIESLIWSNGFVGLEQTITPDSSFNISAFCQGVECNSSISELYIKVYEKPYIIASDTDLCSDSPITLTARGVNKSALLQWYRDGVKIDGATDTVLTVLGQGSYAVASMKEGDNSYWTRLNPSISGGSVSPFYNSPLRKVHFIDSKRGWVLGVSQIFYTSDGGEGWSVQFTGNYEEYWSQIQMIDENLGYISSGKGNIIKTIDGGETWSYLSTGTTNFLYDLHFIDSLVGWAVGSQGTVIKTMDGGNSWSPVITPLHGTNKSGMAVHFLSENKGFIGVNEIFETLFTENGGLTWTSTSSLPGYTWKYQSLDNDVTFSLGLGLQRTVDGGITWRTLIYNLYDFDFINDSLGFIVDQQNQFFKTMDSGQTWVSLPADVTNSIVSIDFLNENEGWAVGYGGQVFKYAPELLIACISDTVNFYQTITPPQLVSSFETICYKQPMVLTATGCEDGTIIWNNEMTGVSISIQPESTFSYSAVCQKFNCVSDASSTVTITVLPEVEGVILTSSVPAACKGETVTVTATACTIGTLVWSNGFIGLEQTIVTDTSFTLTAYCQDTVTGCSSIVAKITVNVFEKPYIVASNTNICSDSTPILTARGITETTLLQWYKDGIKIVGATDSVLNVIENGNYRVGVMYEGENSEFVVQHSANSGTSQSISGIDFVNESKGWIIAGNEVLHTADGGKTWAVQFTNDYWWDRIQMINKNEGFIYSSSFIYKTTDGGENWINTNSDVNGLGQIHFADADNGWAFKHRTLYKTTNGGQNWQEVTAYPFDNEWDYYTSIYFLNADSGFVARNYATVLRTLDGGQTWNSQYVDWYLGKIQITSDTTAFVSGNNGIYKTSDFGNSWNTSSSWVLAYHFVNDTLGYKYEWNYGFSKTIDGGQSWNSVNSQSSEWISSMDIVSESVGWAMNQYGVILKLQPERLAGCQSDPIEIQKTITTPVIVSEDQAVCYKEGITLTATGCEDGTIHWNNEMTGASISIIPDSTFSYSAVCQKGVCVSDSSNVITITVLPEVSRPILSVSSNSVCKGEGVVITALGCDVESLIWSNGFVGLEQTITPDSSFTISAFCQEAGCNSNVSESTIRVYEKPYIIASNTDLCSDSSTTLTAKGINGSTLLQWYRDGIKIEGATDSVLNVSEPANYRVFSMKEGALAEWIWQNPSDDGSVTSNQLRGVNFVNRDKGWVIGGGQILYTDNGGKTWNVQFTGDYWTKLQMINDSVGYVSSSVGQVVKTSNGGQTWTYTPTGISNYLYSLHFTNELNGWAVGEHGTIIKTYDGGQSWVSVSSPLSDSYYSYEGLYFKTPDSGYVSVSGFNRRIVTTDGGLTWTDQYDIPAYTSKFQFTSPNIGYLMGNDMRKTTDGGESWNYIGEYAIDFYFVNDTVGYKSYVNGGVEKTVDGGQTWTSIATPSGEHIWALNFVEENRGWAVGGNGNILKLQPILEEVCESDGVEIFKEVIEVPVLSASSSSVCQNGSVTLKATGCTDGTVLWFGSDTVSVATGNSYSIISLSQTNTYHAECQIGSCKSERESITITMLNKPNPPVLSASSTIINAGQSVTLTASGCAGTVTWSNGLGTGTSKTVTLGATTTYVANCTVNQCISGNTSITITVNTDNPCPPTISHSVSIETGTYKAGQTIQSTANVANGTVYQAGKSITLLPGFQAGSNEVFEAKIAGCN